METRKKNLAIPYLELKGLRSSSFVISYPCKRALYYQKPSFLLVYVFVAYNLFISILDSGVIRGFGQNPNNECTICQMLDTERPG